MSLARLGRMRPAAVLLVLWGVVRAQTASVEPEPAYVATPAARPLDTVSGWVVDANDWLDMGFVGIQHRQTALTNADLGTPLVILTDHGSLLYPVTITEPSSAVANNTRLMPFAEQRVTVIGRLIERGRERGIVIDKVRKDPEPEPTVSFPASESAAVGLVGWVTDLSCWLVKAETGTAYVKGARNCADDGEPLVIVTDSGQMYYPVIHRTDTEPPDFTTLVRYVERKARVTGKVITRGTERAIVIASVAPYSADKSLETIQPGDGK